MIPNCNCLGCQNLAKRLKKVDRAVSMPIESGHFDSDNHMVLQHSENYNSKPNLNVRYERDANTSDLYKTMNIPDRFERPCESQITNVQYLGKGKVFSSNLDSELCEPFVFLL